MGRFVLVDRDQTGCRRVADALGRSVDDVIVRAHDVADEAAWAATAAVIEDRFGRLDLAVANAGVADGGEIADYDFGRWRSVLATNLDGAFLTLRASLRAMRRGSRGGAIVVVASASAIQAQPGTAAYGAAKAGALQLARVAAKEGAPDRIRVNAILPGGVETPIWRDVPFFRDLVAETGSEEAAFARMGSMATPLGRYATAAEIADGIAFLLSDRASFMTGAAQVVDGGYTF